MGDRFYQQQYSVTMGSLPEPKRASKKQSKPEMASTIGITGIEKLLVVDLQKLLLLEEFPTLTMPNGRLKKPYIEECTKVHPDVDWAKLTVATLKNVINNV